MSADHFGEAVAARFDGTDGVFAPEVVDATVDFLAGLAGGGAALELGIGTGRIALPLAARGVPVQGIHLSEAMVARLRAKPSADRVAVTIGDLAATRVFARLPRVRLARGGRPDGAPCGMTLSERWSGWTREPFTSESTSHVSVWQKPG